MIHFFASSADLSEYVRKNDVTVWNNGYGMGTLTFIDTSRLHVVFDTRKDYEDWDACGRPEQLCFF